MNEAEREFKGKGNVSKKFTIPMLFWEEWEEDCRLNFNNTYHLKMQFDHEFKRQFQNVANLLMGDVVALQERVFELEAQNGEIIQEMTKLSQGRKNPQNGANVEPESAQQRKTFGQ